MNDFEIMNHNTINTINHESTSEKSNNAPSHGDGSQISSGDHDCPDKTTSHSTPADRQQIQKNKPKNVIDLEKTAIIIQLKNEYTFIDNTTDKLAYKFLRKFPYNFYSLNFLDVYLEKQYRHDRQDLTNILNMNICVLFGAMGFMFMIAEVYTIFSASQKMNITFPDLLIYTTWIPQAFVSLILFSYYYIGKNNYISYRIKKYILNFVLIILVPFIIANICASAVVFNHFNIYQIEYFTKG